MADPPERGRRWKIRLFWRTTLAVSAMHQHWSKSLQRWYRSGLTDVSLSYVPARRPLYEAAQGPHGIHLPRQTAICTHSLSGLDETAMNKKELVQPCPTSHQSTMVATFPGPSVVVIKVDAATTIGYRMRTAFTNHLDPLPIAP